MCGIFGIYDNKTIDSERAQIAFSTLLHRGSDATDNVIDENKALFHCLHAIVGHVQQPLKKNDSLFVANCEIYNWKTLNELYGLGAANDAEALFFLLEKKGIDALEEVDGVYAFVWEHDGNVFAARDLLGVKPLCYVSDGALFAFASEGKALLGYGEVHELAPQTLLQYHIASHAMTLHERTALTKEMAVAQMLKDHEMVVQELQEKLIQAVTKRVAGIDHVGILFSGGVDSTLLAHICQKLGKKFTCYTAAFADGNTRVAPDLVAAQAIAKENGFTLREAVFGLDETAQLVKDVIAVIETEDPVKVGVAMPFFVAAQMAKEDGCKVLLSGLGSEELFAGYKRHLDVLLQGGDVNEECLAGLEKMWQRDLYRDDLVTMAHTVELRLPFLDKELIALSMRIPTEMKITQEENKLILREAAIAMGLSREVAFRPKCAAQYGSNFDKALEKLAKKAGFHSKKEFLTNITTK